MLHTMSRVRTVLCAVGFVGAVSVRLSSLPKSESLVGHSIAVGVLGVVALGVVLLSVVIGRGALVARGRSFAVAIGAALSVLLQVAKVVFAARGHRELRFEDHVLVNSAESLVYFNVPLVVVNTVDILIWLVCLVLSVSVTRSLGRRELG
ncbi:hypothetical protein ACFVUS_29745 [Nocardia sp. NPDC058058]|uniref:hypothetical protein n=1 Tax=Nocardia sp. NPDC058058 TaxID=3346317 RepID=UPI0036DA6ADC